MRRTTKVNVEFASRLYTNNVLPRVVSGTAHECCTALNTTYFMQLHMSEYASNELYLLP